jgi:uncharacterized protein YjbI with pentapeptide repeats
LTPRRDLQLHADCARCFGLCCVALPFTASADFAVDKGAGTPCVNLRADDQCAIHSRLRDKGFPGCAVYDCFGAGQRVSQSTFGGRDWRHDPETARQMFAVFPVMRQLHELLWLLAEALALPAARSLYGELRGVHADVERLTLAPADTLADLDTGALRDNANTLLLRASELARARIRSPRRDLRGARLIGARLAGADLRGASLRGAAAIDPWFRLTCRSVKRGSRTRLKSPPPRMASPRSESRSTTCCWLCHSLTHCRLRQALCETGRLFQAEDT